ncbi:efflux RND transporter periplasmic adaptor subunit [Sandaracinobacter sp. RS1-74]|uniref:efflux RND transporter periplasmic adaptor subunit n=1 Tax=Sandaracinobacteroides sayramensis TaxID=2913411 RepID=UPI001EDA5B49|nr:efflux RND transporter periplasmic adaptor subunit [Sandaracinobacteroides sayramensis]MCG2841526.1 efflux RND transporter periplasmic adaptor subunit [Sandaracinobacteroides sayramensis]
MTTNETLDEFLGAKAAKPWVKWLKWGLAALALLLALWLGYRFFGPSDAVHYVTDKAERGELTVTVSATGNIKPINQVDVGSEQSGLITQVFVDVNDEVKRGQLLASLDTSRLQDSVKQARASLAAAQAGVAEAEATLAQANATLARHEEVSRLSGGKVPSKTEMDSARADQRRASASLTSARAQVVSQQAALGSAETNLSKARIYSPVTGVVLSRDIEPGQTVAASLNAPVLFTIAEDLSQMELQVSIDEADVGEVKEGQDATFTVDAFPGRRFPANIRRVNLGFNESSSSTTSSSTTGQVVAYTALLTVDNREQTLRPGMTATADIVTTRRENALLVPNAAFRFKPATAQATGGQQQGGIASAIMPRGPRRATGTRTATSGRGAQQTLFVKDAAGQPREITVTTGDSNGSVTEVLSGELQEGQEVITGQLSGAQAGGSRPAAGGAPKAGG